MLELEAPSELEVRAAGRLTKPGGVFAQGGERAGGQCFGTVQGNWRARAQACLFKNILERRKLEEEKLLILWFAALASTVFEFFFARKKYSMFAPLPFFFFLKSVRFLPGGKLCC